MYYVLVCYLFGIASLLFARYAHKKYHGGLSVAFSAVFGLIEVLVLVFTIIITVVIISTNRTY